MPQVSIPSHLVPFLTSQETSAEQATDALEEWILFRRGKGDTLFEVSVGLAELEDKTPPHLAAAFDQARYVTNVPPPTDLTPPMGPFPLARSASPAAIINHLLSQPPPSLEHSREVILEYVLAREGKLREKKPGRGGKGTLGRDGFEDISKRLGEVEDGLRGASTTLNDSAGHRRSKSQPSIDQDLEDPHKIGLALVLSLRMSLSYFSPQELANQLLLLAIGDAERVIVQHIRRRVQGEGRWGVGKELECVEALTLPRRPALRPAFRSAKVRTSLPAKAVFLVMLPAPAKSACIKLLASFARDPSAGQAIALESANTPYLSPGQSSFSPGGEKGYFSKRDQSGTGASASSPKRSASLLSPSLASSVPDGGSPGPTSLAEYAMELVSEFLTREKRDYMLKNKWTKSGGDQLSKDLGEIEMALCLAGRNPTSQAPNLLPVFLLLRRSYSLPSSPLPSSLTEAYLDILPALPDPDYVPFREPTVQTTTATLYVNPRLDDAAALVVIQELVNHENELVEAAGGTGEDTIKWIIGLIESVAKRFPDGSYGKIFDLVRHKVMSAPPRDPSPPIHTAPTEKTGSIHRRSQSAAVTQTIRPVLTTVSIPSDAKQEHKRSFSMPMRRSTCQEPDGNEHSASAIVESTLSSRQLPVLDTLDASNGRPTSGGWWDVVSAVESDKPAPWHENPRSTHWKRTSSISASERFALPPGAEPARLPDSQSTYAEISKLVDLPSPRPLPLRSSPGGARAMNVSPGRNSPGQAADDPPVRTPGKVKTRVDDARPPPPFFPLNISRPSFPAAPADALSIGIISARTVTPASAGAPHPTKFKLGGFGRSMSFAINRKKEEREKDKENEKESPLGGKKVMNSPGKWNRDMVANIMGPPSERK